jgi:HK97 gp10 family phage protein
MVKPSVTVTIKKNDFKKKADAYPGKVSRIVRKTAFDLLERATPNVPVDTGFLRNSGGVRVGRGMFGMFGGSGSETSAEVYWSAFYAIYQEFGTRYIAPNFFATNAARDVRGAFVAALESLEV